MVSKIWPKEMADKNIASSADYNDVEEVIGEPKSTGKSIKDYNKSQLLSVQFSNPFTIIIIKMLTEIMSIFASTILLWIVLDNRSLNNATCDLSATSAFNHPSIETPDPMMSFDCDNLPRLSEFVNYWSAHSNVTNLQSSDLTSYLETIAESVCKNNERSKIIYFLAGYIGALTICVFVAKYLLDYVVDLLKDFKENGVFKYMWFPSTFLVLMCCGGLGLGGAFTVVIQFVLRIPDKVTGYSDLIRETCVFGENSGFAAYCFSVFSGVFGGISALLLIVCLLSWLSTLYSYKKFMRLSGLDIAYKNMHKSKQRVIHSNDPFFVKFEERMFYDPSTFTVYLHQSELEK